MVPRFNIHRFLECTSIHTCIGCFFVRPKSHLSSHFNHLDMAEPVFQMFLLEDIAQLVAHDFRAAYLSVYVRV